MPVVIMQTAKYQTGGLYGLRETDDFVYAVFLNAGAIHPGVHIDEEPDSAIPPDSDVLAAFNQGRYRDVGKPLRHVSQAACIRANHRISDKDVRGTGLAHR